MASVVVAVLFLAAAFFSPIVSVVPSAATAPALIVTGYLMMRMVRKIDFSKIETGFPAFITILLIPLTYSISHGIGYGFIAYSVITLLTGKFRETSPIFHVISALFLISFALE
ncbi:MAG: solute carrier family 23 protein [bacterium]